MRMTRWIFLGLFASSLSWADQVTLQLAVTQVTHVKKDPQAFSGVGMFTVLRGEQQFQAASCPDMSNQDGQLACSITCDKADKAVTPLRVVPPSKSYRVRGFVPPPSADVRLTGCVVNPQKVAPFVYRDAQLVVQDMLAASPDLERVIKPLQEGRSVKFKFAADVNSALPVMVRVAATPEGRQALFDLNRTAGAIAAWNLDPDASTADLLSRYQVGINNILLAEAIKARTGATVLPTGFKLTVNKADYYSNLGLVEDSLDANVARTGQENIWLNDVQALKRQPIDPSRNVILYRHVPGIGISTAR